MSIYEKEKKPMNRLIAKIEHLNESWQGWLVGGLLRTFTGGLTFALIVTEFYYPAKPAYILPAALLMACVWLSLEFHNWRWIVKVKRDIRWTLILDLMMKSISSVLGILVAAVTFINLALWITSDIHFPNLLPFMSLVVLWCAETVFFYTNVRRGKMA